MIVNLLYKGLLTGTIHKEPIELINEKTLNSLKHNFEVTFPCVSSHTNDVDAFTFFDGTKPSGIYVFKWKLFANGKISEIAQLVAIEEVDNE